MMIAITTDTVMNPLQIGEIMKTVNNYGNYSSGWFGIIARLEDDAIQAEIDAIQAILDGYDQLVVITDKATIAADDVEEATITATAGSGDTSIRFDVWDSTNDHAVSNEVVAVAGGEASYQFKTALAETYRIFAYGNVSREMGSVEVVANE